MTTSVPFDQIADRYDATRFGLDQRRRVADFFAPWLAPGPVLEIGVGTGLVGGRLSERGHEVYGVDLSLPMLTKASGRLDGRLFCGDACALPIPDGALSNAMFALSLHAIRNVAGPFPGAARGLRP